MATRRVWARAGMGLAVAGAVGLGLLAMPAGAGAAPELPPVSAEDLVASVIQSKDPGPLHGTVTLDNQLGLPAIPGVPQAANGSSSGQVWSDGAGKGRLSIPSSQGEKTIVDDGTTVWAWDSADRTVTKKAVGTDTHTPPEATATDPAAAAAKAVQDLRATSSVDVDGTATVAGRPAYELVLRPLPSERTLLREVRVAVDSEKRIPLQLTVLANGSSDPALQVGFTQLDFGAQDPALFAFTPPPGSTVTDAPARPGGAQQHEQGQEPTVVGDGWDTVVIATLPPADQQPAPGRDGAPDLSSLGKPVSGAWGSGREIDTAVATAIITDDGRVAAGAVPAQVLTEALAK
ncbi:LolA family protein [Pseudonocardia sp. D17]|uniref:LolA family protein n=1 Tax=Pseudonocardia sp. D17 TaxID=882661 RepID=UPI002B3B9BC3|nr:membrane protein [Pseudonocardia sp. D17]